MEKIVIDSHALFWFLTENQKLSKKAKQAIEDADQVIVPSIVLMEVLFILEKYNVAHQFLDYHMQDLLTPVVFNRKLIDWLMWYNTERVHYAFQNKLSPVEFMLSLPETVLAKTDRMSCPVRARSAKMGDLIQFFAYFLPFFYTACICNACPNCLPKPDGSRPKTSKAAMRSCSFRQGFSIKRWRGFTPTYRLGCECLKK